MNTTSLLVVFILREGEEYRFIHRSVQEFFSASFIASKPENWVKIFYSKVLSSNGYGWLQELGFLKEIDAYRFNKYFLLPNLLNALGIMESSLSEKFPRTTILDADRIIGDIEITFKIVNNRNYYDIISYSKNGVLDMFVPDISSLLSSIIFGHDGSRFCRIHRRRIDGYGEFRKNMKELYCMKYIGENYISTANILRKKMFEYALLLNSEIKNEENTDQIQVLNINGTFI